VAQKSLDAEGNVLNMVNSLCATLLVKVVFFKACTRYLTLEFLLHVNV